MYRMVPADVLGTVRVGNGKTVYDWTKIDQLYGGLLAKKIKPFVELGFMPTALASGDDTVFWWKGNITPPDDWDEWAALVRAVVRHLVDRYGVDEVRAWPIEVWNEPNLVNFWKDADQEAYFRLYEITARTIKDVDAELQVGGPAISPGSDEWWEPFTLGVGPAGAYAATLDEEHLARLRERCRELLPAGAFTLTSHAWAVRGVVAS